MKAILEIDMPKSCLPCILRRKNEYCSYIGCYVGERYKERHRDCPLKVKGEDSDIQKQIDWLCGLLEQYGPKTGAIHIIRPRNCKCDKSCKDKECSDCWREAAEQAVKDA